MLKSISDAEITLGRSDSETASYNATTFLFGIEIEGEVDELLDYTLSEAHHAIRQTFEYELENLELSDLTWLADYLYDTEKTLTVDGVLYGVVNDKGNYKKMIELWGATTARAKIKLKFRRKLTGIDVSQVLQAEDEQDLLNEDLRDLLSE